MVEIKFNNKESMEAMHKALVGSPAYVNNEIAICEDNEGGFSLLVGNCNDNDFVMEINS